MGWVKGGFFYIFFNKHVLEGVILLGGEGAIILKFYRVWVCFIVCKEVS